MSRITVEGRADPAVADAVIRAVFEGSLRSRKTEVH